MPLLASRTCRESHSPWKATPTVSPIETPAATPHGRQLRSPCSPITRPLQGATSIITPFALPRVVAAIDADTNTTSTTTTHIPTPSVYHTYAYYLGEEEQHQRFPFMSANQQQQQQQQIPASAELPSFFTQHQPFQATPTYHALRPSYAPYGFPPPPPRPSRSVAFRASTFVVQIADVDELAIPEGLDAQSETLLRSVHERLRRFLAFCNAVAVNAAATVTSSIAASPASATTTARYENSEGKLLQMLGKGIMAHQSSPWMDPAAVAAAAAAAAYTAKYKPCLTSDELALLARSRGARWRNDPYGGNFLYNGVERTTGPEAANSVASPHPPPTTTTRVGQCDQREEVHVSPSHVPTTTTVVSTPEKDSDAGANKINVRVTASAPSLRQSTAGGGETSGSGTVTRVARPTTAAAEGNGPSCRPHFSARPSLRYYTIRQGGTSPKSEEISTAASATKASGAAAAQHDGGSASVAIKPIIPSTETFSQREGVSSNSNSGSTLASNKDKLLRTTLREEARPLATIDGNAYAGIPLGGYCHCSGQVKLQNPISSAQAYKYDMGDDIHMGANRAAIAGFYESYGLVSAGQHLQQQQQVEEEEEEPQQLQQLSIAHERTGFSNYPGGFTAYLRRCARGDDCAEDKPLTYNANASIPTIGTWRNVDTHLAHPQQQQDPPTLEERRPPWEENLLPYSKREREYQPRRFVRNCSSSNDVNTNYHRHNNSDGGDNTAETSIQSVSQALQDRCSNFRTLSKDFYLDVIERRCEKLGIHSNAGTIAPWESRVRGECRGGGARGGGPHSSFSGTRDVQFIYVLKHQYRRSICASPKKFTVGTVVVLDGDMGVEMGTVSTVVSKMEFLNMSEERREELHLPSRIGDVMGAMVYREATKPERVSYKETLCTLEDATLAFLNQLAQQEEVNHLFQTCRVGLMTFLACEFQADGKKLYVYYRSMRPVRFLELATFLNQIFRCRIWMHEVTHMDEDDVE